MNAVLGSLYSNLRVVKLISSCHKPIKIDPRTTVPANPNIGRVALHRSAEHHRGARPDSLSAVSFQVLSLKDRNV